MHYELCATKDIDKMDERLFYSGAASPWPRSGGISVRVNESLDWITEKLDRCFASSLERSVNDDPVRKKELNVLKRTVLILVCLGLGITALSIKFAIEAQIAYFALG